MTVPSQHPPSPRTMAVLALLGLGGWALLTVGVGASAVVNGLQHASALGSGPFDADSDPLAFPGAEVAVVADSLFVVWLLSLNVVLAVLAVGVVDIALVHRSWSRCVAFAVVCAAGPIGAVVVSQRAVDDEASLDPHRLEQVAPGVGIIAIAALTVAAAWLLLGVRRRRRPPVSSLQ